MYFFFFSSRRRHTRFSRDWSSDVCSSDLTTNPSLVAKNPDIAAHLQAGNKLSLQELLAEYKRIVSEISKLIPQGSVSIEVYADRSEEHTSELQSRENLVCRLLLEKKNKNI